MIVPLTLIQVSAEAGVFTLPQLTTSQTDPIFKVLSADLIFRPIEGAHPLAGSITGIGFEAGITATATSTNTISSIIGQTKAVPSANLDFGLALPFGIGIEIGFLPSVSLSGSKFGNVGGDLRLDVGKLVNGLPFDITLRGMLTSSTLSTDQILNGANINVQYKSTQTGAHLTVGKTLGFIEAYAGLGIANSSSTLSYSGTSSLFGSSFASGTTSVTGISTSPWLTAGVQIRLLVISIGAQYDRIYGVDTISAKLGLRF